MLRCLGALLCQPLETACCAGAWHLVARGVSSLSDLQHAPVYKGMMSCCQQCRCPRCNASLVRHACD